MDFISLQIFALRVEGCLGNVRLSLLQEQDKLPKGIKGRLLMNLLLGRQ